KHHQRRAEPPRTPRARSTRPVPGPHHPPALRTHHRRVFPRRQPDERIPAPAPVQHAPRSKPTPPAPRRPRAEPFRLPTQATNAPPRRERHAQHEQAHRTRSGGVDRVGPFKRHDAFSSTPLPPPLQLPGRDQEQPTSSPLASHASE